MFLDEHDKDIHSDGPCVRLYHRHGGGNDHSAHRLGNRRLPPKTAVQTGGRYERAFTIFSWKISREGREI
jgi:hypothetical protein